MSDHDIQITLRMGDDVSAEFICRAPEGSLCRKYCDEPYQCEYITQECKDTHRWSAFPEGQCNIVTWLSESGLWWEMYEGPEIHELKSAPIVATWNGDVYTWEYA